MGGKLEKRFCKKFMKRSKWKSWNCLKKIEKIVEDPVELPKLKVNP